MNRWCGLLVVVWSALLLVACDSPTQPDSFGGSVSQNSNGGGEQGGGDAKGNPPPPVLDPGWALTARITSVTGPGQACLEPPGPFIEEHIAHLNVSGETVTLYVTNNGFQYVPEQFDGKIIGRDFTAAGPSNSSYDKTECRDGTVLFPGPEADVTGRIAENGLEFTAQMRERWGASLDRLDTIVTWTFTAVRR